MYAAIVLFACPGSWQRNVRDITADLSNKYTTSSLMLSLPGNGCGETALFYS